jgi:hypothetical protein
MAPILVTDGEDDAASVRVIEECGGNLNDVIPNNDTEKPSSVGTGSAGRLEPTAVGRPAR